MSYHILHVFQHGVALGKERGFLTAKKRDESDRRLPIADIRALILAGRGITISSSLVGSLLDHDAIILHCNEQYRPVGLTAPLSRIVDTRAFLHQATRPEALNTRLWKQLLQTKTQNQVAVLGQQKLHSAHLDRALSRKSVDEANCARRYWQLYFPSIGWLSTKRDRKLETPPNQMLNYGYAVLESLCHRSLIVHGLSPQLGLHHKPRAQANPLVYDLMEPFRPVVDLMLAEFMVQRDISLERWTKAVGGGLRDFRVHHRQYSLKLMDAIDRAASSLSNAYSSRSSKKLWLPLIASKN